MNTDSDINTLPQELIDLLVGCDLGEGNPESREALLSWLQAHPEHTASFNELMALWNVCGLVELGRPEGLDLELSNQSPAETGQVIDADLRSSARKNYATSPIKSRLAAPGPIWALAAAVIMAVYFTVNFASFSDPASVIYQTAKGETQIISLEDSSTVHLNSFSQLAVLYEDSTRRLELNQGEALFVVAKDEDRPFVVTAKNGSTRALGTQFNVRLGIDDVAVTVLEGSVEVKPPASLAHKNDTDIPVAIAEKGHQVIYRPKTSGTLNEPTMTRLDGVDVNTITGWQKGRLHFNGQSLADVIDEINRYTDDKIIAEDKKLLGLKIYGVFQTGDTDGVLTALKDAFNLKVTKTDKLYVIYR